MASYSEVANLTVVMSRTQASAIEWLKSNAGEGELSKFPYMRTTLEALLHMKKVKLEGQRIVLL